MNALKEKLIEISDCFYQERIQEGMGAFMATAGMLAQVPALAVYINPLFDALEKDDYILAADILCHEIAVKL